MRFMMVIILKDYESVAPDTAPQSDAVDSMAQYNRSLQDAGVLLAGEGLQPPSMGARVTFASNVPTVTDGPFAEAKEVLGGFWVIDVASKQEAIKWAKRCPGSDTDIIEIREIIDGGFGSAHRRPSWR
jgi:hypothetical protein